MTTPDLTLEEEVQTAIYVPYKHYLNASVRGWQQGKIFPDGNKDWSSDAVQPRGSVLVLSMLEKYRRIVLGTSGNARVMAAWVRKDDGIVKVGRENHDQFINFGEIGMNNPEYCPRQDTDSIAPGQPRKEYTSRPRVGVDRWQVFAWRTRTTSSAWLKVKSLQLGSTLSCGEPSFPIRPGFLPVDSEYEARGGTVGPTSHQMAGRMTSRSEAAAEIGAGKTLGPCSDATHGPSAIHAKESGAQRTKQSDLTQTETMSRDPHQPGCIMCEFPCGRPGCGHVYRWDGTDPLGAIAALVKIHEPVCPARLASADDTSGTHNCPLQRWRPPTQEPTLANQALTIPAHRWAKTILKEDIKLHPKLSHCRSTNSWTAELDENHDDQAHHPAPPNAGNYGASFVTVFQGMILGTNIVAHKEADESCCEPTDSPPLDFDGTHNKAHHLAPPYEGECTASLTDDFKNLNGEGNHLADHRAVQQAAEVLISIREHTPLASPTADSTTTHKAEERGLVCRPTTRATTNETARTLTTPGGRVSSKATAIITRSAFLPPPRVKKSCHSAEERYEYLRNEVWVESFEEHHVICKGCTKQIQLDQRRKWYPGLWEKHRDGGRCPGIPFAGERKPRGRKGTSAQGSGTRAKRALRPMPYCVRMLMRGPID
ncbi:hypothetical protein FB45DRAFT_872223 [Roridomyces roridus]|uniref:Uncharacterized protein n=1 Tax=Roridomyces roridus TaxID=1738132 RepID=A0AAD7BDE4_9AGAR|nr:hypothetical protein FB45DRAFT_872223 [Roridomyces roridus]